MDQKKTAYLGLFAAIAIIFGYVESLIPFFAGIPGMKLGLANLAVLFVLERYTWKEAAQVRILSVLIHATEVWYIYVQLMAQETSPKHGQMVLYQTT